MATAQDAVDDIGTRKRAATRDVNEQQHEDQNGQGDLGGAQRQVEEGNVPRAFIILTELQPGIAINAARSTVAMNVVAIVTVRAVRMRCLGHADVSASIHVCMETAELQREET
jgi:hypothetical protein